MVFPKRSTVRRKVKERFEELQLNLKERLQQLSSKMSYTIDRRTSIAGYYGVTMHDIDNEWKYRSVVLDSIPSHGRHTGEDIAMIFHECLLEYEIINKIQDNQHFRCFAHILNLGVQDLLRTLALHCETDTNAQDQQYEDYADKTEEDEEYAPNIADSRTSVTKLRKSLRKFNEPYEEYYSLHSLNKSLELPRKENKVCDKDEDVIDFDKLYECPSTSSGSCLQGIVIDELEEYLRKPRAASSEDILDWWRTHETEYPTLSKMARDFLSILATSVPAERLLSKASLVIRKHRNRLSDESARWLLCINSWSKELI
ncbi:unnamed protein product [Diatraea saccharalis]|uniref:HAT C-terminal dimerisation domain-containing protein n=1 Tax=Diatraea saccharalis TaxID=40085 RepID=A0A9N9RC31_9NEOP|nr:unnamed protein product [Diatraea saccharalis]